MSCYNQHVKNKTTITGTVPLIYSDKTGSLLSVNLYYRHRQIQRKKKAFQRLKQEKISDNYSLKYLLKWYVQLKMLHVNPFDCLRPFARSNNPILWLMIPKVICFKLQFVKVFPQLKCLFNASKLGQLAVVQKLLQYFAQIFRGTAGHLNQVRGCKLKA